MHLDFSSLICCFKCFKSSSNFPLPVRVNFTQFVIFLFVWLLMFISFHERVVSLLAGALFWARNDLFYLQVVKSYFPDTLRFEKSKPYFKKYLRVYILKRFIFHQCIDVLSHGSQWCNTKDKRCSLSFKAKFETAGLEHGMICIKSSPPCHFLSVVFP